MSRIRNKKHTVLLFDNDSEFAENIKLYLENIYDVKVVSFSEQIIPELRKKHYDFLVSDFNSLNTKFSYTINKISKVSASTKIILMCTFFDAEIDNERYILSKVDDYIFKPFNVNLLKYKISRLQTFNKEITFAL